MKNIELVNDMIANLNMFATQPDWKETVDEFRPAIGLFEQGRRRPCLRNLLKLCEGLRCTPNDLLL